MRALPGAWGSTCRLGIRPKINAATPQARIKIWAKSIRDVPLGLSYGRARGRASSPAQAPGGSGAAVCQFLCGDANNFNRDVSPWASTDALSGDALVVGTSRRPLNRAPNVQQRTHRTRT